MTRIPRGIEEQTNRMSLIARPEKIRKFLSFFEKYAEFLAIVGN